MLRAIGALPPAERATLAVTLVDPQAAAWYSGMVTGCIAGLYEPAELQIPLAPLAAAAGAAYVRATAVGLDHDARQLHVRAAAAAAATTTTIAADDDDDDGCGGATDDAATDQVLPYDLLSLDVGSAPRDQRTIPGVAARAICTRPVARLLRRIEQFERDARASASGPAPTARPAQVCIVGAGAAGIELAFALHARWSRRLPAGVHVRLVHRGGQAALLEHGTTGQARRLIARHLAQRGIELVDGDVVRVERDRAYLASGPALAFDALVWAAGAEAVPELRGAGFAPLHRDARSFVRVRATLESVSCADVFGAGDCIAFAADGDAAATRPLPKSGVYAVRQGPILAANLLRRARALQRGAHEPPLQAYEPQSDALKLLGTGDRHAIGVKFGIAFAGAWVWRWKDHLDRAFVRQFHEPAGDEAPDAGVPHDVRAASAVAAHDTDGRHGARLLAAGDADALGSATPGAALPAADAVLRRMADDATYRAAVLQHLWAPDDAS